MPTWQVAVFVLTTPPAVPTTAALVEAVAVVAVAVAVEAVEALATAVVVEALADVVVAVEALVTVAAVEAAVAASRARRPPSKWTKRHLARSLSTQSRIR